MVLIKWEKKYSVGVSEIDNQHQQLFEVLNKFILNFGAGNSREEVQSVLEEMISYMDYHFTSEERYLKQHSEFEKHRRLHADFVQKTLQLQKDFLENGTEISQDILKFLIKWLKNHILATDMVYFDEMKKVAS
jgi:hemerythrin